MNPDFTLEEFLRKNRKWWFTVKQIYKKINLPSILSTYLIIRRLEKENKIIISINEEGLKIVRWRKR